MAAACSGSELGDKHLVAWQHKLPRPCSRPIWELCYAQHGRRGEERVNQTSRLVAFTDLTIFEKLPKECSIVPVLHGKVRIHTYHVKKNLTFSAIALDRNIIILIVSIQTKDGPVADLKPNKATSSDSSACGDS